MSDQWAYFPCAMGEHQAFVFVDVGISESINTDAPNGLVTVRLAYRFPDANGLPTQDEFDPVKRIEDHLESFVKEAGDWYVGRVTVGGARVFFIYSSRDSDTWEEFLRGVADASGYELAVAFGADEEHRGYWDDLYPTADDWRVIRDLRLIEQFESTGDDGSQSRTIDHWVYVPDAEAASTFVAWAKSEGFTHHLESDAKGDDDQYGVRLTHDGTLALFDITHRTIALSRKASELGGEYDGWEAPVMKSNDDGAAS